MTVHTPVLSKVSGGVQNTESILSFKFNNKFNNVLQHLHNSKFQVWIIKSNHKEGVQMFLLKIVYAGPMSMCCLGQQKKELLIIS